ncbi:PL29 family lyase N-terminal domain-containing protein [Phocaeicola sartorii]|jgi:hypothetical protein|uniref:PL29 family lyase N-terminal domain-containing protein n=1 Tax=Phocaeicola sartorii TaxID=671267 RepID=UPI00266F06CA|nr:hypothetical protein [Phocaeicola sartorii]
MNKKFLSAVLFGALMVSSTGTFVSCKDYDEDIDRIDKELVDIKSALSALQAKVDAGKYVTNVVKNGDGITVTWSDNSTSTIETIKGDKGEDGKNGTVVTIIDGYWAFDGVKSEYPAKGDKGDKGDQGEPGDAAAAGHDAKISENGYWMVWDAEKAAYVETEYIAGGAVAAQVKGGWNITVKDENGDEQTIFIPSSATMGYMDVLNGADPMCALYGINEKDVEYGPAKKTLKKGLYTTLDRDLQVVVNPQGTDASAYSFSLMNSANVDTELPFKEAVPFKDVLTRATSENAVWVLPHDFVRYENIDDARTKNYLLFKANDGAKHALSLTATLNETTIKTPYDLSAQLKKIGEVYVGLKSLENCAVNVDYTPIVSYISPSVDAAAVYDYWITLEQSAKNLKNAQLYGVEIDKEGHSFKFTRETGVNNSIEFVYNYILMDGTIVQGDKDAPHFLAYQREEMANAHEITLERLYTPMDATVILDANKNYTNNYVLTTKAYDLTTLLSDMSDVEKAVWKSAIASHSYKMDLIGGEDGAEWNTWWENNNTLACTPVFDVKKNTVTFSFYVNADLYYNYKLNKAYQLTVTVNDEDTKTPVASIILPFEFTQPTLDITRVNGEKAIWNDKKNVLSIYGDLVNENYMYVPFYEAFTTAYATQYSKFGPSARYYTLSNAYEDDAILRMYNAKFLGRNYELLENVSLTDIVYSSKAAEWNTWAYAGYVNDEDYAFNIIADYKFYGVYPATKEQVSDFTLRFASLLGDAKKVEAKKEFTSNNVTREVVLTDADFTLVDALDDTFYLFDGVKADGNVDKRSDMNLRQGFEEGTEGFATNFTLANANASAYYYKNGNKVAIPVSVGAVDTNATFETNTNTKTRAWVPGATSATNVIVTDLNANEAIKAQGYAAVPGGIMIQLPSSIGTTEPVTIEFKLKDVFGVTKTLKVVVKAAK